MKEGIHLKSTADFSLKADEANTKYLLVSGERGSHMDEPRYSFA
jgi:hypothetical protein